MTRFMGMPQGARADTAVLDSVLRQGNADRANPVGIAPAWGGGPGPDYCYAGDFPGGDT